MAELSIFKKGDEKPSESARVDKFLAERAPAAKGRLIFGLDATGSRSPTWDLAMGLQAEMFREAASIGGLELQLAYYRGVDECRSSSWTSESAKLMSFMQRIQCASGMTQIGRILAHALKETTREPVSALVFIGDAMEESPDKLVGQAGALGRVKVPAFMFQEGDDRLARRTFEDIARATGGASGRFEPGAGKRLSELLKAVAAFAAGGRQALEGRKDEASRLLLGQMKQ
jgi:hypothetical protein